jgi:hypothetical protein
MAMFSCNSPAKQTQNDKPRSLRLLDKSTLLNIVGDLAKTISKKGATTSDGVKLLRHYALTYNFKINESTKQIPDTGYVIVDVDSAKTTKFFTFHIPKLLQQKITFVDLKNKFGNYLNQLAKEPVVISTSFHPDDAPDVLVSVRSGFFRERPGNYIEQITVVN